jgi:hypothetical protein
MIFICLADRLWEFVFVVHVLSPCNSNLISDGTNIPSNEKKFYPEHGDNMIDHRILVP